jgi:hypothetical protein
MKNMLHDNNFFTVLSPEIPLEIESDVESESVDETT